MIADDSEASNAIWPKEFRLLMTTIQWGASHLSFRKSKRKLISFRNTSHMAGNECQHIKEKRIAEHSEELTSEIKLQPPLH